MPSPVNSPAWQAYVAELKARTAANVERTVELTNAGLEARQIAVILGVALQTVYGYRRAAGLSLSTEHSGTTRRLERAERVAELTRQGLTAKQIAEKLKITTRTVVRDRKAAGITQPTPRWFTADEIALGEQLLDDGCSLSEVARTLGRHVHSVFKRWPGRGWTKEQSAEWMAVCRLEQSCG